MTTAAPLTLEELATLIAGRIVAPWDLPKTNEDNPFVSWRVEFSVDNEYRFQFKVTFSFLSNLMALEIAKRMDHDFTIRSLELDRNGLTTFVLGHDWVRDPAQVAEDAPRAG